MVVLLIERVKMMSQEMLSVVASVTCLFVVTTFGQDVPACDRLVLYCKKYCNTVGLT